MGEKVIQNNSIQTKAVVVLVLVNLFYASISIATKLTSQQVPLSLRFFVGFVVIILMLGIYAVIWQQVLKQIPLSTAYMFKGTSLVFVLLFSSLLFGEGITCTNGVGAALIIGGIAFFAKA